MKIKFLESWVPRGYGHQLRLLLNSNWIIEMEGLSDFGDKGMLET